MAVSGYIFYGGGAGDFTVNVGTSDELILAPGDSVSVHTARTQGSRITTLYSSTDAAITDVVADADGTIEFQAPDGLGTLYLLPYGDGGVQGTKFYPIQPADIGDRLVSVENSLSDAEEALSTAQNAQTTANNAVSQATAAADSAAAAQASAQQSANAAQVLAERSILMVTYDDANEIWPPRESGYTGKIIWYSMLSPGVPRPPWIFGDLWLGYYGVEAA